MKSSITNCNSNDQLLQLVSFQLLQKAYFRQFMFEGSNYFTVFLLSLSWRTKRHQLKKAAHQTMQPMSEATGASTRQTYNFQFSVLLPSTGNRSLLPTPSVLLSHWWHRMLFLLQHHRLSLKDFSQFEVCWLKALVIIWKNLCTWVWIKVNFDDLNDILLSVDWLDLITWITDYVWITEFSVLWITNSESLWLLCDAFINWLKSNRIVT